MEESWGTLPLATAEQRKTFESTLYQPKTITVVLKQCTWNLDANLLAEKSTLFAKIVEGDKWKENKDQSITLHDDSPWIFARVLQYVYYGRYTADPQWGSEVEMTPSVAEIVRGGCRGDWTEVSKQGDPVMEARSKIRDVTANIAMYLLADKYCMTELQSQVIRCLWNAERGMYLKDFIDVGKDHHENMSGLLKDWFAGCVGNKYAKVLAEENENAKTVKGWLAADSNLCFMVMEHMHERLRAHRGYEDDDA
ncbi:hypothetical protein LTR70_001361 [Exophiala xenobiotica]|uniref:BTB domain-containing protein n=1 Tax=Lithohypha guttulata TaxID=1690604 RepID=A0ABR0KMM3_9EURO|nr:hypothetical protein LTR24_000884 [Lithohypha guttulata]KAK5328040.1 hypothetical protein LTR70_001361 [Exophiala xenobiotica]